MSPADLAIPFTLGLVSSLHCTQMCGPLVLAYSLPLEGARRGAWPAHAAYNAGRIATYSMLGAAAGAAGGGMAMLGRVAGIERVATIFAGAALLAAAVLMGGRWRRLSLIRIGDASASPVSRAAGRLLRSTSVSSKLALGLVLGLLPCGMVYAALIKAIETGSAVSGALTMVAFGLGTSGALLTIGLFSTAITARLGRHASTVAAASVAVLGAYLLWRGLAAPSPMGAHGHGHHS